MDTAGNTGTSRINSQKPKRQKAIKASQRQKANLTLRTLPSLLLITLITQTPQPCLDAVIGAALGGEGVKIQLDQPDPHIGQQERLGYVKGEVKLLLETETLQPV